MAARRHIPADRDGVVWAMFVGLTLAWGASFLFLKIGLNEGLEPFTLVAWRMTLATLFLVAVLVVGGGHIPRAPGALPKVALLGVLNVAVPALLITWGTQSIPSALASILNGLQPLFAVVRAALVLHDEPLTLNRLVGLLAPFPVDALAIVVEFGGLAEQTIVIVVALALHGGERRLRACGRVGCIGGHRPVGRIDACFINHDVPNWVRGADERGPGPRRQPRRWPASSACGSDR